MPESVNKTKANFGTMPVFVTAISTILGAILFLRFGYAVGQTGLIGAFAIIILGHLVTIPTALAVAEIATNQKVEGGGAYYIISRSFGLNIGAVIGITLFLSQAISVAFYIIAFSESLMPFIESEYINYFVNLFSEIGLIENLKELNTEAKENIVKTSIGILSMSILTFFILRKGANVGMKALYFVAAILFISLIFFFLGETKYSWCENKAFDPLISECPSMGSYASKVWKDSRFIRNNNPNFSVAMLRNSSNENLIEQVFTKGAEKSCFGKDSFFSNLHKYDQSLQYLKKCLKIRKKLHEPEGIAMAFKIAGLLTSKQNTLDDEICINVSFPEFSEILGQILK